MLARVLARLPWAVGNDGLTALERRGLARQWRRGLGGIPSREATAYLRTWRGWGWGLHWPLVVLYIGPWGSVSAEDDRVRFIPFSERQGRPRGHAVTFGRLRLAHYPRHGV